MIAASIAKGDNKMYYEINEDAARRAKRANSFSDYKEGSATAEYRAMVDRAVEIAEKQKANTDLIYHEKIDRYLALYTLKLAQNMNKGFEIDARVPSIMISGAAKFPVRKKEKQNEARDRNYEEWKHIQGLLDKIRSVGTGGISADDPNAIKKLEEKLEHLKDEQAHMKLVNAYYRKHGTCKGCEGVSDEMADKIEKQIENAYSFAKQPYPSYHLTNNNAKIKSTQQRIDALKATKENPAAGWKFDGGEVVMNTDENRVQIMFDEKPDETLRAELKSNGFRWAPSQGAWQRQLTQNGIHAAKHIKAAAPTAEETP